MQALPERVSVIGAGSWGTALACLLCRNFEQVLLWGRDPKAMRSMAHHRRNVTYLPDAPFPDNLDITAALPDTLNESASFVLAVPSHCFRSTLEAVYREMTESGHLPRESVIIWGTKGFDPDNGHLLSQICEEVFGEVRSGVISGPSFASETARGMPTALTMACSSLDHARDLARWFHTDFTRTYYSDDPVGVQLGGAIKNVMAIAAGISDGLGYGANARAALITRGLSELSRIGVRLGGRPETLMGLSGLGDLVLTCTTDQSRNRRFGIGIGQGKTISQVRAEIGQEIEGINTTGILYRIALREGIEIPITDQVFRILHQGAEPKHAVGALLSRNPRAE